MLSDKAIHVLEGRGLDVEMASRLGFDSEVRGWPVQDGGHTTWHNGEAVVIPFIRNGEVVRRKYKRITDIEGAPSYLQDKGATKAAFNEDCLRDDSLLSMPVIITEGELDCLAALQSGFLRSISVPDGAPPPGERTVAELLDSPKYNWIPEVRPFLTVDRAPEIILATDGDDNGAALLQDLSLLFDRSRCKYVTYPKCSQAGAQRRGRERCKDLNEVLEDWGVNGVSLTIGNAKWIQVDGVYRMSELQPQPPRVIYQPRGELIREHARIRMGDISVWTGIPNFGKTTYLNDFLCGIAQDHNVTVAWASFEQEPQEDHRRNLRKWFMGGDLFDGGGSQADADRWIDERHVFLIPSEVEDPTLDWLIQKMSVAVVRYGVRVIVIDPWNELEHSRQHGESETDYIGRALRLLKRFCKSFKVHICIVAHPTKSEKDKNGNFQMPSLYDISGSAHWFNKSDLGVIIHRESKDDTIIKVQKSKYHDIIGRPGSIKVQFCAEDRRFRETERVSG